MMMVRVVMAIMRVVASMISPGSERRRGNHQKEQGYRKNRLHALEFNMIQPAKFRSRSDTFHLPNKARLPAGNTPAREPHLILSSYCTVTVIDFVERPYWFVEFSV